MSLLTINVNKLKNSSFKEINLGKIYSSIMSKIMFLFILVLHIIYGIWMNVLFASMELGFLKLTKIILVSPFFFFVNKLIFAKITLFFKKQIHFS